MDLPVITWIIVAKSGGALIPLRLENKASRPSEVSASVPNRRKFAWEKGQSNEPSHYGVEMFIVPKVNRTHLSYLADTSLLGQLYKARNNQGQEEDSTQDTEGHPHPLKVLKL